MELVTEQQKKQAEAEQQAFEIQVKNDQQQLKSTNYDQKKKALNDLIVLYKKLAE